MGPRGGGGAQTRCAAGRARRPGPWQPCDGEASTTRRPIAAPRNLRHPLVWPDRTPPARGVLAYLPSASPSRPHSRPAASRALQSQGGRFVRAPGAGQYFAGGAEVRDGRPSKGRDREPARPSFPYVRTQLLPTCGSRGLRRAPSPPPARPRPRLHDPPLLPPPKPPPPRRAPRERPGRTGLQATRFLEAAPCTRPAGTAPALALAPAPAPEGKPQPVPVPSTPGRAGRPDGAGAARGLRAPPGRRRGSRKRASRLPRAGAQAPVAAAGTMAAGARKLSRASSRSGTAAPSALGSRLGRGHPELWAPVGRAGRARGGGAGAVPARARLLLFDPRCWGGGGESAERPRGLSPRPGPGVPPGVPTARVDEAPEEPGPVLAAA